MSSSILARRFSINAEKHAQLTQSQLDLDAVLNNFSCEAADSTSLAAMTLGSFAFRFARLSFLQGAAFSNLSRVLPKFFVNGSATIFGLGVEVSGFRAVHNTFASFEGHAPEQGVFDGKGWMGSFVDFATLKTIGYLGGGRNFFITHFSQANAMVIGHEFSADFGLNQHEQGSYVERLAHAEMTNIAMGAGMGLMRRVFPFLAIRERSLSAYLQVSEGSFRSSIASFFSISSGEGKTSSRLSMQAEGTELTSLRLRRKLYHGGDRPALVGDGGDIVTYDELAREVELMEGFLLKIAQEKRSETVGMFFDGGNRREFFTISLAARRVGLAYSLFSRFMNPKIVVEELIEHGYKVLFLDSKAFTKFQPFLPLMEEKGICLVDIDSKHASHYEGLFYSQASERISAGEDRSIKDLEAIIYRPVPSGFERVERAHDILANYSPFPVQPSDVHLVVDYLFHEGNLRLAYAHLETGAAVYMPRDRSIPNLHRLIEEVKVTTLLLHPWYVDRFYEEQLRNPRDLSSLRRVIVYAAHFDVEQRRKAQKIFGRDVVYHIYSTTHQGLVTALGPSELLHHPQSVGRAVKGVELEIRDENSIRLPAGVSGVVYVKTPFTYGQFEATEERGFLDVAGYLILGMPERQYPTTRGTLVDTSLVEEAMFRTPGVSESYVMGLLDAYSGEKIVAAVVLGAKANIDATHIQNSLNAILPDNRHVPKDIVFLPSFPRMPEGTVDRQALLQIIAKRLEI